MESYLDIGPNIYMYVDTLSETNLILLHTHDLSLGKKLPKSGIATFAFVIFASLDMAILDINIQTSYGGVKNSKDVTLVPVFQ